MSSARTWQRISLTKNQTRRRARPLSLSPFSSPSLSHRRPALTPSPAAPPLCRRRPTPPTSPRRPGDPLSAPRQLRRCTAPATPATPSSAPHHPDLIGLRVFVSLTTKLRFLIIVAILFWFSYKLIAMFLDVGNNYMHDMFRSSTVLLILFV